MGNHWPLLPELEEWKNGRMEEWKNGRMEEWKNGRMEEWKNGRMEEEIIGPLLPELPSGKRGRPWRDNREVLEGILWVMRTGAPWRDMPKAESVSTLSNLPSSFSTIMDKRTSLTPFYTLRRWH